MVVILIYNITYGYIIIFQLLCSQSELLICYSIKILFIMYVSEDGVLERDLLNSILSLKSCVVDQYAEGKIKLRIYYEAFYSFITPVWLWSKDYMIVWLYI